MDDALKQCMALLEAGKLGPIDSEYVLQQEKLATHGQQLELRALVLLGRISDRANGVLVDD